MGGLGQKPLNKQPKFLKLLILVHNVWCALKYSTVVKISRICIFYVLMFENII